MAAQPLTGDVIDVTVLSFWEEVAEEVAKAVVKETVRKIRRLW